MAERGHAPLVAARMRCCLLSPGVRNDPRSLLIVPYSTTGQYGRDAPPLPPGEGLGGEAGVSRTMVRAGRTASACMPMRALQVRDERVMKSETLARRASGCSAQL